MKALLVAAVLAADFAVNGGAIEVVGLPPQHLGLYPYAGISLIYPGDTVTLIPGVSYEFAPENGRNGLVLSLVADFPLSKSVGFDLDATVIHDQPGLKLRESVFFAGAGVGTSFYFGALTLSPYLNLFIALDGSSALSVVPGFNVAWVP